MESAELPTSGTLHVACYRIPHAKGRLLCLLTGGLLAAPLVLAALLRPVLYDGREEASIWEWASRGTGTHMQMRDWPAIGRYVAKPCQPLVKHGIPCPTCGMTTAFALFMHGHPVAALACQPLGALAAAALAVAALSQFVAALSGYGIRVRLSALIWKWLALALLGGGMLSWFYKVVAWRLGA